MTAHQQDTESTDVVVVGAGFAGLYAVHRLRGRGFGVQVFEAADDVGGTWYWNRYPGARVDIPSLDYMYSFDPDWRDGWEWSEKYATQPEILQYLNHVADKFDLRRDIHFGTRVRQARWDDVRSTWLVSTDRGDEVECRHLVMASGCLSKPKDIDIEGIGDFSGSAYSTSHWPHDGVDFTGQKVAVIGTGSSGIQTIPLIAEQAAELVVFQRTPCFSMPAHNGPTAAGHLAQLEADEAAYREGARYSRGGVPMERNVTPTFAVSAAERERSFEEIWAIGELLTTLNVFADLMSNQAANDAFADFVRAKIRAQIADPHTADVLCPNSYPIGSKRLCLDTGYYRTYNRPNVRLVDLQAHPLDRVTFTGVDTVDESFDFDAIVFATGFDAMTGAIAAVDISGRNGQRLAAAWAAGPSTYLGLMSHGFPNLFFITGPGSPSVLSNMAVSIEQHVDWVADCLTALRADGHDTIEPTPLAEAGWMQHVADCAAITLFPQANSWYVGANVPNKPRAFMAYAAGVDFYRRACDEVVTRNYLGFKRTGSGSTVCEDGVVRQLQPDVQMVLEELAALGLPELESLPAPEARTLMAMINAPRPPGPDVGEIVDGMYPGAEGPLNYRLYRPPTAGPHSLVVYFHGGGWVLGDSVSDDPLCRDLCLRADAVIVSVDYRHAPEAPFPAAVDDALAAVRWAADHAAELGAIAGELAVCGWSAGGGLATVVCRLVRDLGGPHITGQALLTPVADTDFTRASYAENAEGYGLTTALMRWFSAHYAGGDDPRRAPLGASDLAGLPPAIVVTCQFDPLRDEGVAYAAALTAAGVPTEHLPARGHTHLSLTMVDLVVSGEPVRARLAEALRGFSRASARTAG